jgi:hypothetical protein
LNQQNDVEPTWNRCWTDVCAQWVMHCFIHCVVLYSVWCSETKTEEIRNVYIVNGTNGTRSRTPWKSSYSRIEKRSLANNHFFPLTVPFFNKQYLLKYFLYNSYSLRTLLKCR